MWTRTFHRFDTEAAFLAACDAAGWPRDHRNRPVPPAGVDLDIIGALVDPPTMVDGRIVPGEVDARWHVNASWLGLEVPEAFAGAQVTPAAPTRSFADRPVGPPPEPAVPSVVAAWKAKEVLVQRGLLDDVETAVAASGRLVQRAWTGAAEWSRDSRFIAELAKVLNLEPGVVDLMFREANTIKS
jgi:hypothetical protein